MDGKYDKKKESIDEILSDLNGLLNKMPSILDGIRMPEMRPPESPKPEQAAVPGETRPEAANKVPSGPVDLDKTVVLESFAGLQEGSLSPDGTPAAPQEQFAAGPAVVSPSPFDADKTVVLEPFAGLPEGSQVPAEQAAAENNSAAPAQEKLVPQSLGDYMFGPDSEQAPEKPAAAPVKLSGAPLEPPLEKPVRAPARGPSLSVSDFTPPLPKDEAPVPGIPSAGVSDAALGEIPQGVPEAQAEVPPAFQPDFSGEETGAGIKAYDNTHDFGIPDIDALLEMSDNEKPAAAANDAEAPEENMQPAESLPGAEAVQEPGQVDGEQKDGPLIPVLEGFEPQFIEAAAEGDKVETEEPKDEKSGIPQPDAAMPAMDPGEFIIEPELKPETSFEAFTIEPSSPDPVSAQDGGETLRLDPAPESIGESAQSPQPEETADVPGVFGDLSAEAKFEVAPEVQFGVLADAAAEPEPGVSPEVQFGVAPDAGPEPKPEAGQDAAGAGADPAAGFGIELAPGIELGAASPGQPANPEETLPGGLGLELGGPSSPAFSGEETLVVAPPSGGSGEEEKTVIFQSSPITTSRAQAGDLTTLAARQVPEGIPEERVRSLAFLYSPGDEALCATVIAELDAICLKSATKPMFIKRAYVKECDIDSSVNLVSQSVADAGAAGLVCLGAIPQEKIYELENAFSSSGGFFRAYDSASFNHSTALDLVTDLIVR